MTPEHIQKLKKQWNAIKRIRGGVMTAGYSTGDGKSFYFGTDDLRFEADTDDVASPEQVRKAAKFFMRLWNEWPDILKHLEATIPDELPDCP